MFQLKSYIKANWQRLFDVYIFLNFLGYTGWLAYSAIKENRFDFIEISFFVQNLVLTSLFLIRRPSKSADQNFFHQAIALVAFFSGALFMGNPETNNPSLLLASKGIILFSNILGMLTLLNLGKSFGILISYRKVQSKGLYSIVRHPIYVTDILLRIGFLISHFSLYTISLFVVSTACYIYRAILEERFLALQPEYMSYMKKVKYRFIPFIY
jgi:protein-S-isoprenylcysteine O-methyltransferase Ste14